MSRRILIVRLSALGDIALTLPLLWTLRDAEPESFLGWVAGAAGAGLLRAMSELDRLHVVTSSRPAEILRMLKEIRAQGYDISLDPQGIARSALVPFLAGVPTRAGFRRAGVDGRELSWLFSNRRLLPPRHITHVSQRTLYLAQAAGVKIPERIAIRFPRQEEEEARIQSWWDERGLGTRVLIFAPGAGWSTKEWPLPEMRHLIDRACCEGWRIVLLWGPRERGRLQSWRKTLQQKVVWAPRTNVYAMCALLRRCAGYAGPDSSPLHLAWWLGKPTFSWFGPSDPRRCAPRGVGHCHVARGKHDWRRRKPDPRGLPALKAEEIMHAYARWLHLVGERMRSRMGEEFLFYNVADGSVEEGP